MNDFSPLAHGNRDSSPTRQFPDMVFGDSSPTDLKTVLRHFLKTVPRHVCSVK